MSAGSVPAGQRWAEMLAAWAIPEEILAAAPESPWGFPPELFAAPAAPSDTPSRQRALETLPEAGSVLDVGAGAGAAGLSLVPPAAQLTAVDEGQAILEALRAEAGRRGVADVVETVTGRWPDVAPGVGPAHVVVCHHVAYNVADIVAFLVALSSHARRRVVVEVTDRHPQADLNPLWLHFHGLSRPEGPTADDLVAVLAEVGIQPGVQRFARRHRHGARDRAAQVAFARRRLCLPASADPEVDKRLGPAGWPNLISSPAVCLWWNGTDLED